jgi:phosphoglycerate dehydrogenase-like enzyme
MSDTSPLVVVIDTPIPAELVERLRALGPRVELHTKLTPELVGRMHVVYSYCPTFEAKDAPKLKWVQLDTASIAHVLPTPIGKSTVPIANVRGAYSVGVAEFAVGILLALTRKIHLCHEMKLRGKWLPDADYPTVQGTSLYGKTMGIVGYGSIGRQIARIVQAMGMNVLAWKRDPSQKQDDSPVPENVGDPQGKIPSAWFGPGQMGEMFARTDVAMVVLPQTPSTLALVGERELSALPRGARFVNVGRGATVDEAALIKLLSNGHLAGAALDVFAPEPPDEASPLWKMPNVVMAPHIASYTDNQTRWAGEVFIENIRRHLAGKPLVNLIDRAAGY